MKRMRCNGKYTELLGRDGDIAERARWLTWTRIRGSVWPIVSLLTEKSLYKALTYMYLCYSIETSDVEVRQYS